MLTHAVIQTNHGVSYPVVGPTRIEQAELISAKETPDETKPRTESDSSRSDS